MCEHSGYPENMNAGNTDLITESNGCQIISEQKKMAFKLIR